MGVFNELGKVLQVETWGLDHVAVVDGIPNQARKAVPQEIEITCGTLDVGERGRITFLQEIEPRSAHDCVLEIPEQFLVMLLADAVEVDDLPIEIIQNFHSGRLLTEKHL